MEKKQLEQVSENIVGKPIKIKKGLFDRIYSVEGKPYKTGLYQRIAQTIVAGGLATLLTCSPVFAHNSKHQEKPRYATELETEYGPETGDFTSRVELTKEKNYLLRLEHTDGNITKNRLGAKVPVKFSFFKGYVNVFGANDSKDNWGQGINVDGKLNDTITLGGAAEKSKIQGAENQVVNLYTELDLQNLPLSLGIADLDREKDRRTVYHGTFFKKFVDGLDRLIIGIGGLTDNESDHYAHIVLGQYPQEKGNGFGWRLYGTSELEGDATLDLMLALNSNLSHLSYLIPFGRQGFFHERKIRAANNIMDYVVPPTQLYQKTKNLAAAEINYNHKDGQDTFMCGTALYPTEMLKKLGVNTGNNSLLDNLWLGGEYNTGNERFTGKLGTKVLDGKVNIYGEKTEGEKPYIFTGLNLEF